MKKQTIPQIQVRSDVRSGQGGGWVNGTWYADRSGVCGGFDPGPVGPIGPVGPVDPIPPNAGGGWIGESWYPDRSGTCG